MELTVNKSLINTSIIPFSLVTEMSCEARGDFFCLLFTIHNFTTHESEGFRSTEQWTGACSDDDEC